MREVRRQRSTGAQSAAAAPPKSPWKNVLKFGSHHHSNGKALKREDSATPTHSPPSFQINGYEDGMHDDELRTNGGTPTTERGIEVLRPLVNNSDHTTTTAAAATHPDSPVTPAYPYTIEIGNPSHTNEDGEHEELDYSESPTESSESTSNSPTHNTTLSTSSTTSATSLQAAADTTIASGVHEKGSSRSLSRRFLGGAQPPSRPTALAALMASPTLDSKTTPTASSVPHSSSPGASEPSSPMSSRHHASGASTSPSTSLAQSHSRRPPDSAPARQSSFPSLSGSAGPGQRPGSSGHKEQRPGGSQRTVSSSFLSLSLSHRDRSTSKTHLKDLAKSSTLPPSSTPAIVTSDVGTDDIDNSGISPVDTNLNESTSRPPTASSGRANGKASIKKPNAATRFIRRVASAPNAKNLFNVPGNRTSPPTQPSVPEHYIPPSYPHGDVHVNDSNSSIPYSPDTISPTTTTPSTPTTRNGLLAPASSFGSLFNASKRTRSRSRGARRGTTTSDDSLDTPVTEFGGLGSASSSRRPSSAGGLPTVGSSSMTGFGVGGRPPNKIKSNSNFSANASSSELGLKAGDGRNEEEQRARFRRTYSSNSIKVSSVCSFAILIYS